MKYILGALTAITLLAGVAAAQPAEARCWGPAPWQCGGYHHHDHGWGWHHRYWHHHGW
jgi:hypothetical protein